MQISFTGKRVIVAGGSRGIGRSIALAFATEGADVAICARGAEGLRPPKRNSRSTEELSSGWCATSPTPRQ